MIPDTLISLQHLIFAVFSSGDDRCPGADGRGMGSEEGACSQLSMTIISVDRGHRIVYMLVMSLYIYIYYTNYVHVYS